MFSLIRSVFTLICLASFAWFGMTVPLGKRTLFQHVQRIWKSDEAQELVDGVKEKGGPAIEKAKRSVEAGIREANEDVPQDSEEETQPPGKNDETKGDNEEKRHKEIGEMTSL